MTGGVLRAVAPVSAVCAAFAAQPRVPAWSGKSARCAAVRERRRSGKRSTRAPASDFGRCGGEAGERPDAFLRPAVHFCPQCGQFRGMKMALFCGC